MIDLCRYIEGVYMIWECTVCTNHFDGPSPPDLCHSCGSPREYFTAYHYYGLVTPNVPYSAKTSPIVRSSYAESTIEATTCYRFHSTKHFHGAPLDFYRNFLETRRTFLKRDRFAGRGFNSGFYFAMTRDSSIAETAFYENITTAEILSQPDHVLRELRSLERDCIFLEVTLTLQKVADLTDPVVLEYFLREGPARASFQPTGVPYALAKEITPSTKGGNKHTDGIGYHAYSNGWNAVKFPSVRALKAAWGIDNLSSWDILTKTAQNHPRASEDSIEDQLRNQAIIVVFSGSLLTRSVSRYAWVDSNGTRITAENPYFGVESRALESVRLAFREQSGLTPLEAVTLGYLSDEEIIKEFTSNVMWVPSKESFY
jgi:hypothetical protein